jgi:hypothetical protein
MATSVKQLLEAADAVVPKVTPAQAREMMSKGYTLVVDVRDAPELEKSVALREPTPGARPCRAY